MNPKKIAILRANALGDFLVALPAIESLKATFPNAEITLLGAPWHEEFLLPGRCAVDRVVVVPPMDGIRSGEPANENEIEQFFAGMQREEFDMAFHFQGNGLSANAFLLELGAGFTAGCTTEGAPLLTESLPFYYYQSEVLRYLEVVSLVGVRPVGFQGTIGVLPQDREETLSFLRLMGDQPFVVLHPFATDVRREWVDARYPPLADALAEAGYGVVFTGLQNDTSRVNGLLRAMKHTAVNACGMFSLGGLSAIYQEAALVIGPDTGPLHLARATGTRTIGLYWAPNFINWAPLQRAGDYPLISWRMECPLCGIVPNEPYPFLPQHACRHETSFIDDLEWQQVAAAAVRVLNKEWLKPRKQPETSKNTSA